MLLPEDVDAKATKHPGTQKTETLARLPRACANEAEAVAFLEAQRGWDKAPTCPRCAATSVYQMKDAKTGARSARWLWRCLACKRQYTVRIGTVFEDSRIPLRHWCFGFWAMSSSKKGISALQIRRQTGLSYKSALFLCHRIRWAMADDPQADNRVGGPGKDVEANETYVGGKPRAHGKKARGITGRGTDKVPVFAVVERGGDVRMRVLERLSGLDLGRALIEGAHPESRLLTDEWRGYIPIGKLFPGGHETVKHRHREYARGNVHSQTVESVFSLLKRGLMGTFHSVSRKHLPRYLAEFAYRWNTRYVDDGERTSRAIKKAEGKRLFYRPPTGLSA